MGMGVNYGTNPYATIENLPTGNTYGQNVGGMQNQYYNPQYRGLDKDTVTLSTKTAEDDKKAKRNKTIKIAAAIAAVAAVAVTAYAASRGKKLNAANSDSTKFINNIKTGFKSFFNKDIKAQYKTLTKAAEGTNVTQSMIDAAKKREQDAQTKLNDLWEKQRTLQNANAPQEELDKVAKQIKEAQKAVTKANNHAANLQTKFTLASDDGYQKLLQTRNESKAKVAELTARETSLHDNAVTLEGKIGKLNEKLQEAQNAGAAETEIDLKSQLDKLTGELKTATDELAKLRGEDGSIAKAKAAQEGAAKQAAETLRNTYKTNRSIMQADTHQTLLEQFKARTQGRALTEAEDAMFQQLNLNAIRTSV